MTQSNKSEIYFSAYTVQNFAKQIQLSESMLWKLIKNGQLKTIKIGRRVLVPSTEIQRLLNGGAS